MLETMNCGNKIIKYVSGFEQHHRIVVSNKVALCMMWSFFTVVEAHCYKVYVRSGNFLSNRTQQRERQISTFWLCGLQLQLMKACTAETSWYIIFVLCSVAPKVPWFDMKLCSVCCKRQCCSLMVWSGNVLQGILLSATRSLEDGFTVSACTDYFALLLRCILGILTHHYVRHC